MLNEPDIKKALFEKLSSNEEECVVANEMVSERGSRRADMVLITDILCAFEIKGTNDSLKRLSGQIKSYQNNFNKTVLVVTDKHIEGVLDCSAEIGVWLAYRSSFGDVRFKIVRKGKKKSKISKNALCDFMHKSEIASLLNEKYNSELVSNFSRDELVGMAMKLPVKALTAKAIACLKKRYYWTHQKFLAQAKFQGTLLQNEKHHTIELYDGEDEKSSKVFASINSDETARKRKIDFSKLLKEDDDLSDIPQHVFIPN